MAPGLLNLSPGGKAMANYNDPDQISLERNSALGGQSNKSTGIVESLKERGKEQLEAQKRSAAEQGSKVADALERATEELDGSELSGVATYTGGAATKIRSFADALRNRNIEDLMHDARMAARRNPELFFAGAIGAGILLSRFFKASERKRPRGVSNETTYGAERDHGAAARRSASTTTAGNRAGGGV
jgi:hypothetical protein